MNPIKWFFYINGRSSSFNNTGKLAQENISFAARQGNNQKVQLNGNLSIASGEETNLPSGLYIVEVRPATQAEIDAAFPPAPEVPQ